MSNTFSYKNHCSICYVIVSLATWQGWYLILQFHSFGFCQERSVYKYCIPWSLPLKKNHELFNVMGLVVFIPLNSAKRDYYIGSQWFTLIWLSFWWAPPIARVHTFLNCIIFVRLQGKYPNPNADFSSKSEFIYIK